MPPFSLYLVWRFFCALVPHFTTESWAMERVYCEDPMCPEQHYEVAKPLGDVEEWETYDAVGVFRVFKWLGFTLGGAPIAVAPWPRGEK